MELHRGGIVEAALRRHRQEANGGVNPPLRWKMATFRRKQSRLQRDAYNGRNWYFITLNAEDGQPILGEGQVVSLLVDTLPAACMKHMFDIYAYCFMPNHIHIEPVGLTSKSDLIEFMRTWKGTSTVPLRESGLNDPFQKGFYDHILRPDDKSGRRGLGIFSTIP